MSIPVICPTAATQDAAASPSVAVSAAAVAGVRPGLGDEGGDLRGIGGVAGAGDGAVWMFMVFRCS